MNDKNVRSLQDAGPVSLCGDVELQGVPKVSLCLHTKYCLPTVGLLSELYSWGPQSHCSVPHSLRGPGPLAVALPSNILFPEQIKQNSL